MTPNNLADDVEIGQRFIVTTKDNRVFDAKVVARNEDTISGITDDGIDVTLYLQENNFEVQYDKNEHTHEIYMPEMRRDIIEFRNYPKEPRVQVILSLLASNLGRMTDDQRVELMDKIRELLAVSPVKVKKE
jgi:hypothetical protein